VIVPARACSRLLALAMLALASIGLACAQPAPLREKVDYIVINPQPVATGNRIEVVEFFWYGCPHCNNLQPALEAWLKRKPADVELRRIPAIFRESWAAHARLFYTLEALGELDRLHQAVYRAIHVDSKHRGAESPLAPWVPKSVSDVLATAESTSEWASNSGIPPARWLAVYNAPEIIRKVEQSKTATKTYAVQGTPSLVVDGRYLTSSGMAESMPGVIKTLEGLIVMARDRRSPR
jgi:thiol:disulfide interchange protein DsbA